jgi:hypothetical protein
MSDPRRFAISIMGLTALVMNSPAGMLGPPEDKGRDKLEWEKAHMLDLTYRNPAGALIIPTPAVRRMFIAGCRFVTDKPKGTSFKSFAPLIEATLFVEEDAVLDVLADKVVPYIAIVNLNPSKGPRGPRGPRCRPMIPVPWRAETCCTLIDDAITADHLAKIADVSGRLCGLLDGRTIGFGRCEIAIKAVT